MSKKHKRVYSKPSTTSTTHVTDGSNALDIDDVEVVQSPIATDEEVLEEDATSTSGDGSSTTPTDANTDVPPTDAVDAQIVSDDIDGTVKQKSALPARPIKTVAGTGASATFRGVGTMAEHGIEPGLRRNAFQDRLLAWNEESGAHLDDNALAVIMDNEHPQGGVRIADRPELVQVIRKFYNAGKHGKQQGGVPDVPSLQYGKPKAKSATPTS